MGFVAASLVINSATRVRHFRNKFYSGHKSRMTSWVIELLLGLLGKALEFNSAPNKKMASADGAQGTFRLRRVAL